MEEEALTKRNTETQHKIKIAFGSLLKSKGFDAITVSDITRLAKINRGTFYLHYLDKFDLKNKLQEDILENLSVILLDSTVIQEKSILDLIPYDAIFNALVYCKGEFDLISSLLASDSTNFISKFKNIINQLIESQSQHAHLLKTNRVGIPEDYAREILLSSVVSIVLLWINKGAVEDPASIARIIDLSKKLSPYEFLSQD